MIKCVSILGSTGSIGRQSLDLISRLPEIRVTALTAGSSVALMAEQCRAFRPELAVMATREAAEELKAALQDMEIRIAWGEEGLIEAATVPHADCVITAVVGMVGLKPTLAAIREGKRIGLANKETLVCAGELVMAEAEKYDAEIIPVDSEHSAIFQCLMGSAGADIEKIHLTASGGPFRTWSSEDSAKATRAQALNHPNWSMGSKITIDSATMMNKGLEIIEARWLFGMPGDKIEVVIHPESIIHSMIEYADGSVIAQMGHPDMREAIQFAFSYPYRLPLDNRKLNFAELGSMSFFAPDAEKFPALGLAYESLEKGGNMACIMNAANEAAVEAFLKEQIGFYDITDVVQECMSGADFVADPDLETIFRTNETVLAKAAELIGKASSRKTF